MGESDIKNKTNKQKKINKNQPRIRDNSSSKKMKYKIICKYI